MKLEGLRVIDLSMFLPGPHLTQMMADHGAEVIKLEAPGEGEPNRHIGLKEDGVSIFFRNTHRGKKSLCLNLKDPAAREALLKLCETADVFVEAFRPGVVDRLGVGYRDVSARNPRIVYCSISAFGQSGPYRELAAHNLGVEAVGGSVSVNLGEDGQPAMPGMPISDITASLMGFGAVMMALYRRERTGRGDFIDMSMHDSLLGWLPNVTSEVFVEKRPPEVKTNRTWGGGALYRLYRTKDGKHVALAGQEIKFARNLLGALDRLDLLPLCERGPGAHQQPVIEFLQGVFAQRTQAEWVEWFKGRDICFMPVKNLREAFDDPHAQARGMRLLDEKGREHIGVPIKFQHEPGRPNFRTPAMGEHNAEILRSLGYGEAEIATLTPAPPAGHH